MKPIVLITGGSEGLGYEIAKLLMINYQVIILASNPQKTEIAAKELGCKFLVADVSDYDQVVAEVSKLEHIDLLINDAGIWIEGPLETNDPQRIKKVLEVNSLGTINLTKAVLPKMSSGKILNVISQAGLNFKSDRSVYYASKWAITGFTKCMQEELKPKNILVSAIYPGGMKTNFFAKTNSLKDVSTLLDPVFVAKKAVDLINSSDEVYLAGLEIPN